MPNSPAPQSTPECSRPARDDTRSQARADDQADEILDLFAGAEALLAEREAIGVTIDPHRDAILLLEQAAQGDFFPGWNIRGVENGAVLDANQAGDADSDAGHASLKNGVDDDAKIVKDLLRRAVTAHRLGLDLREFAARDAAGPHVGAPEIHADRDLRFAAHDSLGRRKVLFCTRGRAQIPIAKM
jgi:hypothetical protein